MTPTTAQPAASSPPAAAASAGGKPKSSGGGGGGGAGHVSGLRTDVSDGQSQAHALGKLGIPVYFPKLIMANSQYCQSQTSLCPVEGGASSIGYPRAYLLHDRQNVAHYAYRMTLEINPVLGQYYGVQGTTWQNPPLLNSPTTTKTVNGKQLMLYANGSKLSLVAWRTSQGVYWISNTLTDDIGNSQLVAIAASLMKAS
jgi:hypothetical protein